MRRILIALVIGMVMAGGAICYQNYLHGTSTMFVAQIDGCVSAAQAGDWADAVRRIDKSKIDFEGKEPVLCAIIDHKVLEQISLSYARAASFAKNDSQHDFFAECEALKYLIEHVIIEEELSIKNIL